MSEPKGDGLDIRCRVHGCKREAAVLWKGTPLCAPHYQERIEQNVHSEPVNTPAGQLEPGMNRHP